MAYDPGYPGNGFRLGRRSTMFGGGTAVEFGGDAWLWLNGLAYEMHSWLIDYFHKPWTTQVALVQEAVTIGDILVADLALTTTDADGYTVIYVRRLVSGTGATNAIVIGIALESVASFSECHYAVGGLLPANMFTGVSGFAPGTKLAADATSGRLKVWATGDEVLAYAAANGAILLLFPGRLP